MQRTNRRFNSPFWTALLVAAILQMSGIVVACSVPVFRYALDHWTPDNYRIHVLHGAPLNDEQAQLVERLKEQAASRFANAVVEVGEVEEVSDPALLEVIGNAEIQDQPLCVLQGPTELPGAYRDVWSGPLTTETPDALLGSPVRDRLARLLLDGTSVVWIYLDSGVAPIDDANFAMLEAKLQQLEGELKLPEIDPADLKELSVSPDDVQLKLAALRLSRDDPKELPLVQMLLSSEPDLRDAAFIADPMAFAVFGRGRVLYSLVGKGITPALVEEASRFLSGACQCTVKAQNPGIDLLMAVDWEGLISPSTPADVDVTLTGLAGFQSDNAASAGGVATGSSPVTSRSVIELSQSAAPSTLSAAQLENEPGIVAAAITEAVVDPAETPAATPDMQGPTVIRRPQSPPATGMRPIVVIAMLGCIVIIASVFLLPRR